MPTTRATRANDEMETADFGDRRRHGRKKSKKHGRSGYYAAFGNAVKRKLKRPYKRSVIRKGRKLVEKRKIGHVDAPRGMFKWVTRGGGVYAGRVSKKSGGGRRKAPKRAKKK
jgi:hypothetical protein